MSCKLKLKCSGTHDKAINCQINCIFFSAKQAKTKRGKGRKAICWLNCSSNGSENCIIATRTDVSIINYFDELFGRNSCRTVDKCKQANDLPNRRKLRKWILRHVFFLFFAVQSIFYLCIPCSNVWLVKNVEQREEKS